MTKREDLRRRLKQADRRRSRRPAPEPLTASAPSVDFHGLTAAVILRAYQNSAALTDRQVLQALDAIARDSDPKDPLVEDLAQRLRKSGDQHPEHRRAWRSALNGHSDTLRQYHNDRNADPRAYLQFLAALAQ